MLVAIVNLAITYFCTLSESYIIIKFLAINYLDLQIVIATVLVLSLKHGPWSQWAVRV